MQDGWTDEVHAVVRWLIGLRGDERARVLAGACVDPQIRKVPEALLRP